MSISRTGLAAFGGGPLAGDCWVRVLYLDESGIGKISNDPILVVAGVVIHADTQWGPLQRRLDALLADMTPFGAQKPRFIHAKDIYHGSGEYPRETWGVIRRNTLLKSVGELVEEFKLPVPWMAVDRNEYALEHPDESPEDRLRDCYTIAAVGCFMQTELYMRQQVNAAEVCSCILEENKTLQKRIPEVVEFLRNPAEETAKLLPGWESVMPLTKMIDHPSPQPKNASSILQIADYCAFSIKRHVEKKTGRQRLIKPLVGHLLRYQDPEVKRKDGNRLTLWNPAHLPDLWPHYKVEFKDGRFKKAGE